MTTRLSHPVIKAFAETDSGSLQLRLPDDKLQVFAASKPGPHADLQLRGLAALDALLAVGQTGFANAYADGLWESEDLPALLTWGLLNSAALEHYFHGHPLHALGLWLKNQLFDANSIAQSKRNILAHYDLGNDFYALWLDKSMTYSCALFDGHSERTLEEAQQAKYARILSKLSLASGAHILEIGCGWGGFAEAAARQGYQVTAITISDAQAEFARERMRREKLQDRVSILCEDYRNVAGRFDGIVSIGMFEHVGQRYWPVYFATLRRLLKPKAKAMVQSIILDDEIFERLKGRYGFIEQVVFPGGMLPSRKRFVAAAEKAGLAVRETFAFGEDYARTLHHWLERFEARKAEVRALGYDETFIRMWRFYLSACIASFASKRSSVMQAELQHH